MSANAALCVLLCLLVCPSALAREAKPLPTPPQSPSSQQVHSPRPPQGPPPAKPLPLTPVEKRNVRNGHRLSEILSTEVSYVAQLHDIADCQQQFEQAGFGEAGKFFAHTYFSTISPIKELHDKLLADLQSLGITKDFNQDTLVKTVKLLKDFAENPEVRDVYGTYAADYDQYTNDVLNVPGLQPIREFLEKYDETLAQAGKLLMTNIRITPVQRLPRYQMFLNDFVNDFKDVVAVSQQIKEAHESMTATTTAVNLRVKERQTEVINKYLSEMVAPWQVARMKNTLAEKIRDDPITIKKAQSTRGGRLGRILRRATTF